MHFLVNIVKLAGSPPRVVLLKKERVVMVNLLIRLLKLDLLTLRTCVFKVYECLQRFLGDSPTPVLNNATGVLFQVMLTLSFHFVASDHVSLITRFVAAAAADRCQSVTGLLRGCPGTLPSAETAPPSGQENGCI